MTGQVWEVFFLILGGINKGVVSEFGNESFNVIPLGRWGTGEESLKL